MTRTVQPHGQQGAVSATCTFESPDIHSSSEEYARRFSGCVGRYLLEAQTREAQKLLEPWSGGSVLDIGGGHAQMTLPLLDMGFDITILGSTQCCFDRAIRLVGRDRVKCLIGELADPPLPDKSVDVAIAFRVMAHTPDWPRLILNMCRVAKHAVVLEFPTIASLNWFAPRLKGMKKRVEGNTRDFLTFREFAIKEALSECGFNETRVRHELFWPFALHRALNSVLVSKLLERPLRAIGFTELFGSPAILCALRTGAPQASEGR